MTLNSHTNNHQKQYLLELDSLRALAVIFVLIYHAFPNALPGGFIGVDVFFVISGYVISRSYLFPILRAEKKISSFFIARIRRLMPAWIVVVISSTLVSTILLEPDRLISYGWSLLAQVAYIQNFVFWSEGDYFSGALSKPLLHTWSLAVEEQFYIAWAISLVFLRKKIGVLVFVFFMLVISSYLLGSLIEPRSPKTAFYMLPTRIWEFGLGILAYLLHKKNYRLGIFGNPYISILMVTGITVSAFFSEQSTFPGIQSLLACFSTAWLILVCEKHSGSKALNWLRFQPAMYVGKISYGLYLWHWPPLCFFYIALNRPAQGHEALLLLIIALVGSILSFRFIENPIKQKKLLSTNKSILSFAIICAVLTTAAGTVFQLSDGLLNRYPPKIQQYLSAPGERGQFRCGKVFSLLNPEKEICPLTEKENFDSGILILGDSHADVIKEMLGRVGDLTQTNVYLTKRNCDLGRFGSFDFCSGEVLSRILSESHSLKIRKVIAISFWETDKFTSESLSADISQFVNAKIPVEIMQTVPYSADYSPRARALESLKNDGELNTKGIDLTSFHSRMAEVNTLLASSLSNYDATQANIFSTEDILCPQEQCSYELDGTPLYIDHNHLSFTGADLLAPKFEQLFSE